MAKKKEFKAGTYAVLVGIVLAVVLTALTIYAFTTRYTGFSGEKVAQQYVDTIVQTGDGYNAYKNTLVAQNPKIKYGDFIRRGYMALYVNEKDAQGNDIPQADFVGTGSEEEQEKIDEVYDAMYSYYLTLIEQYGWDNYDAFYTQYFTMLKSMREVVYEDDYMDMEYMFGALEANVATYGESLTGVEEQIAQDGKTVLREASEGKYQELYGENYRLTTTVREFTEFSDADKEVYLNTFRNRLTPFIDQAKERAEASELDEESKQNMVDVFEKLDCSDRIEKVAKATVEVTLDNGTTVAIQDVYVVKIGNCWFVDNTNIGTENLYLAK